VETATQTCVFPIPCGIPQDPQTGEFIDHPSIAAFEKDDGNFRLVACWVDFFHPNGNKFLKVKLSDDGVAWSPAKTLDAQANVCTVNGTNTGIAVAYWQNNRSNPLSGPLKYLTSTDAVRASLPINTIRWSQPQVLVTTVGQLVTVAGLPSTTQRAVSVPYALVIPGRNGLRAVWQKRDNPNQISQVFVGDLVPFSSGISFASPNVEKFLPGGGNCGVAAGAYQATTPGHFRYAVWSTAGVGAVGPIFASGIDLDAQSFPRIGDYTGVDCSGRIGWAAWTDLRNGKTEIWGAVIPLE
jgi:hypothetical protein